LGLYSDSPLPRGVAISRSMPLPRSNLRSIRRATAAALPTFVKPQLSKLVKEPPAGPEWLHEIKFDGYRMHARLDHGDVRLLRRRSSARWDRPHDGCVTGRLNFIPRASSPRIICAPIPAISH